MSSGVCINLMVVNKKESEEEKEKRYLLVG